MMLEESFLCKQDEPKTRDVLNYLNGYLSSLPGLDWYLETDHGEKKGIKVNYKLGEKAILAINIRKTQPVFRADLRDSARILNDERVFEKEGQFAKGGWRSFKFNHNDEDVEFAKNQFRVIVEYYAKESKLIR